MPVNSLGSVDAISNNDKKFVEQNTQPQVAFVNSVFDNFGGNSQGSTETAFNA
ncbi:hypothetical protein IKE67_07725 [bacterium]|nr:hypothetical protein [bacterium]